MKFRKRDHTSSRGGVDRTLKSSSQVNSTASEYAPSFVYDGKKPKRKGWTIRRKIFVVIALILIGTVSFVGVRAYASLHKVIQRNTGIAAAGLDDKVELAKLKGEGDGRVNILVLGVGDANHAGADLSDTIMVISIDPRTNDVAMLGIPRDLYVKIPGYGYDKINAANAFGEQAKKDSGPDLAKQVVSDTLGIPIHYYIRVDFSGLKSAVDSLGGISINVPDALYDPEYPCDANEGRACGFSIKAGEQQMNGATALKYSRCRKGNCGNDFGRAARQQQVMVAMRDKALQLSTLTDLGKITALIDVIGNHVRTDLQIGEIQKVAEIAKQVDQSKIINKVLDDSPGGLVTTDMINGASVVIPRAGVGNYKDIQAFVRSIFVDGYIKQEAAKITIENGTTTAGLGTSVSELLKSYNYTIIGTSNADATTYQTTVLYDYTGGKKPYTINYLENRFRTKARVETAPTPTDGAQSPDIKLIIGADYKPE